MLPPVALPSMPWMLLSCLMLLSQVQGEDSKKELHSTQSSCPQGSYAYRFHCYALFMNPKSWADADTKLQSVYADCAEESYMKKKCIFPCRMNIVFEVQRPNAGGWEWNNNDLMNYFAWERDSASIKNLAFCGSLSQSPVYLRWKDYNCK